MIARLCLAGLAQVPALESGDVVFQASESSRSALIREATQSPLSHVGLVEVAPDGVYVIEAISPVSRTPWKRWKARGQGGRVQIQRAASLSVAERARVVAKAKALIGVPYDARYRWDEERLYCSELVAKAFTNGAAMTVGYQQAVGELRLTPRMRVMAELAGVSMRQQLLTPASLAADSKLVVVYSDFVSQ
jgi:hypothetical protein